MGTVINTAHIRILTTGKMRTFAVCPTHFLIDGQLLILLFTPLGFLFPLLDTALSSSISSSTES